MIFKSYFIIITYTDNTDTDTSTGFLIFGPQGRHDAPVRGPAHHGRAGQRLRLQIGRHHRDPRGASGHLPGTEDHARVGQRDRRELCLF